LWKNDDRNGYGYFYSGLGGKYFGEFKDDSFNGYGIYIYSNGSFYEGEFEKDLQHGLGRNFSNNYGLNEYAVWENDNEVI
jgi:hypothetical protein